MKLLMNKMGKNLQIMDSLTLLDFTALSPLALESLKDEKEALKRKKLLSKLQKKPLIRKKFRFIKVGDTRLVNDFDEARGLKRVFTLFILFLVFIYIRSLFPHYVY